jgi:hypothetical protein
VFSLCQSGFSKHFRCGLALRKPPLAMLPESPDA